jgi:hypothetical protein
MPQWFFVLTIVAAALVCPALMWLGRRGIGPGCAICPPRRRDQESLDDLRARQRRLAAQIEELEAAAREAVVAPRD